MIRSILVGTLFLALAPADGRACDCHPGTEASPSQTASVRSATLAIQGMDCAACTAAIRIALKKLDGVKEARVSFDEKRAVVDYEPAKVTPAQLVEAINKLGYKASLPGT